MEFFYELLLTAFLSLFAAFLLGKLFSPDDAGDQRPQMAAHDRAPEAEEEEKIIEVDKVGEIGRKEEMATTMPAEEEWVAKGSDEVRVRPLAGLEKKMADESPEMVDTVANVVFEEEESKQEAKCDTHVVHQVEEPVAKQSDEVGARPQGGFEEEAAAESPEMEFGEWEGIERSDVEKRFGAAAAFAASESGAAALSKLDSDVQVRLHGLLKVATEGPCYDSSQPLTLRPSSRAKWVAWQRLGNMNPEVAMEQYMTLLSEYIPKWMGEQASDIKQDEASYSKGSMLLPKSAVHTSGQQCFEGKTHSAFLEEGHISGGPNLDQGIRHDSSAE